MSLIALVIAYVIGILLADHFALPLAPLGLLAAGLGLLAWLWRHDRRVCRLLILGSVCLAGGARMAMEQGLLPPTHISHYAGRRVTLVGSVAEQPDRRDAYQTVRLAAAVVDTPTVDRMVSGLVQLRLPAVPEVRYGQQLQVDGKLELPNGGPTFDYRTYLARQAVHVVMETNEFTVLPGIGGSPLRRPLLYLNDRAHTTALRLLPEPHASFLAGILLGVQGTIPPAVLRDFSATGTSHILVLSGWNIGLVMTATTSLLRGCGVHRRIAAWAALLLLTIYVLFVGGSPSVLRAATMGMLVVIAELVGRTSEPWTLLFAALGCMCLLDPQVVWNIGFQLSALATAGLFAFAPASRDEDQPRSRMAPFRWASELLMATIAASVLTLPVLLYYFGQLSLVAPLANLIILPAVPLAMAAGAIALVGGMVWLPLGQLLALFTWPLLSWMLAWAAWLGNLPLSAVAVRTFEPGWLWGFYGLTAVGWLWRRRIVTHARFGTVGTRRSELPLADS